MGAYLGGCLDWSKAEAHVRKHEINDLTKPSHGIFSGDAVEIVEGAWAKIKDKKFEPNMTLIKRIGIMKLFIIIQELRAGNLAMEVL